MWAPFGTVVYNGFPRGIDWLLARVDAAMVALVDPTLCHWGGPGSMSVPTTGEQLIAYGFGSVYGSLAATRARTGVAWSSSNGELSSFKFATRLDFALADASAALGTTLTLVPSTAPVDLAGSPQG